MGEQGSKNVKHADAPSCMRCRSYSVGSIEPRPRWKSSNFWHCNLVMQFQAVLHHTIQGSCFQQPCLWECLMAALRDPTYLGASSKVSMN